MIPAQIEEGSPSVPRAEAALVSRTCEVTDASFRAFLAGGGPPRLHWTARDGLELVGAGAAVRLVAEGSDRFEALREGAAAVFDRVDRDGPDATRPRMLGGVAFNEGHGATPPWTGFPAAAFFLPRAQLTRADGRCWLTVNEYGPDADPRAVERTLARTREALDGLPTARSGGGGPPGVTRTRRTASKREWVGQVERAIERIRAGDLRKVVLATAMEVDLDEAIDVADVLERLRRTYPDCFRFLVQPTEEAAFFGPTPERLVRKEGRRVETEALAGSVPRGGTPEADADLARSLVESGKLRHEQRLVVEAVRDQLASLGDVAEGERGVRKLANVQHLRTPIAAELDGDEHVLSVVEALHPTPAVGGLPPARAWETIRGTEAFDRGWYAAPVGWFDAAGDGEFAVGIRSAVAGGRRATLFAGSGIVADSDPDEEWNEVQNKYRPIMDELRR